MSDKNLEPVEEHKCLCVTRSTDVAAVAIIVLHLPLISHYTIAHHQAIFKLQKKKGFITLGFRLFFILLQINLLQYRHTDTHIYLLSLALALLIHNKHKLNLDLPETKGTSGGPVQLVKSAGS